MQGISAPDEARQLHLTFDTARAFEEEYARNLTKGGAFVRTDECFELREIVEVAVEMRFLGETLTLAAEVVHCMTAETAPVGTDPGVAIQFLDPGPKLRRLFEPFVEEAEDQQAAETAGAIEAAPDSKTEPTGDAWTLDGDVFDDEFSSDAGLIPATGPLGDEGPELALATDEEPLPESEDPNERTHRPRSDRAAARIPVNVRAPNGQELRARTRNLSESGVLLSVDGEELPLGKDVTLRLVHPATGEPISVGGRVVRHIEGEGAVAAVAVHLQPDDGDREAVERFVTEMGQADREQRKEGIRGPLDEMGPVGLLQMFTGLAPCGTLTITSGSEEGVIAFEDGALLMAHCRSVNGIKALARIFSWRTGFFEFRGQVEAVPEAERDGRPIEAVLLEALRVLDESKRFSGAEHEPSARFRVERDQLDGSGDALSQTEEAVLDLAGAGFTLRRMLDVIPDEDGHVHQAIDALLEKGVLVLAD